MDEMTDGDGDMKDEEEGAALDEAGEMKRNRYTSASASEDASGPEITAKAFAYSRFSLNLILFCCASSPRHCSCIS